MALFLLPTAGLWSLSPNTTVCRRAEFMTSCLLMFLLTLRTFDVVYKSFSLLKKFHSKDKTFVLALSTQQQTGLLPSDPNDPVCLPWPVALGNKLDHWDPQAAIQFVAEEPGQLPFVMYTHHWPHPTTTALARAWEPASPFLCPRGTPPHLAPAPCPVPLRYPATPRPSPGACAPLPRCVLSSGPPR